MERQIEAMPAFAKFCVKQNQKKAQLKEEKEEELEETEYDEGSGLSFSSNGSNVGNKEVKANQQQQQQESNRPMPRRGGGLERMSSFKNYRDGTITDRRAGLKRMSSYKEDELMMMTKSQYYISSSSSSAPAASSLPWQEDTREQVQTIQQRVRAVRRSRYQAKTTAKKRIGTEDNFDETNNGNLPSMFVLDPLQHLASPTKKIKRSLNNEGLSRRGSVSTLMQTTLSLD